MAAASGSKSYTYKPLQPKTSQIRLLRIENGDGEKIHCVLEVVHLDTQSQYKALSYTWADPLYHDLTAPQDSALLVTTGDPTHEIICDGSSFMVTKNLYDALYQLRKNATCSIKGSHENEYQLSDYLWIDAVCIDQANLEEKSIQIRMMSKIYENAAKVIVWLGQSDQHTSDALELMSRFAKIPQSQYSSKFFTSDLEDPEIYELLGEPCIIPDQWLSYAAFLQRTYFSRTWVIQEIFFARDSIVLCGDHIFTWAEMTKAALFMRETNLTPLLTTAAHQAVHGNDSTVYTANQLGNILIFQDLLRNRKVSNSQNFGLEALLTYGRFFDAKVDLDKVFALQGIWKSDHDIPKDMEPDYKKGVHLVYARASWETILENGDLNVLSMVEDWEFRRLKNQNLPSWVPDYSTGLRIHPLSGNPRPAKEKQRWNASSGLEFKPPEVPKGTGILFLPVKGYRFDVITEFAATLLEFMDDNQTISLLEILKSPHSEEYPISGTYFDAFWKTLIKDTILGQPTDVESRAAFPLFVTVQIFELETQIENYQWEVERSEIPESPENIENKKTLSRYEDIHSRTKSLISDLASRKSNNGVIPSWDTIRDIIQKIKLRDETGEDTPEMQKGDKDYDDYFESFRIAYSGRRLFRTEKGFLGIAAQSLMKGDEVWILAGAAVPVVLRQNEKCGMWKLVGEAYVHGIMNGEGLKGGGVELKEIILE